MPHFSSFCIQTLKRTNYTDVSNLFFWVSFETTPNRLELLPFMSGRYVFSTRSCTEAGDQFLAFFLLDLSEAFNIPELYFFIAFPGSHILGLSFHMIFFFLLHCWSLVPQGLLTLSIIYHINFYYLSIIYISIYSLKSIHPPQWKHLVSWL